MSTSINIESERTPLLGSGSSSDRPAKSWGNLPTNGQPTDRQIVENMTPLNPQISQTQIPNQNQPVPIKKVMAPLRIEPKVYFANERTFLSWLHFCIVLGGLALGLLNFGDRVGQISGLVFTLVALTFMGYSVLTFQKRAEMIRRRDPGPYDDTTAPLVLCVVLFVAVGLNFYLKFTSPSNLLF
ncbi:UNVERIFIED_CONTAM: hypothetical protein HDU68_001208 [Siphonaria sp. JEL0065]|nr:hypothetical protein HDU68_001208 [Siphonaria sp. JEL0065]